MTQVSTSRAKLLTLAIGALGVLVAFWVGVAWVITMISTPDQQPESGTSMPSPPVSSSPATTAEDGPVPLGAGLPATEVDQSSSPTLTPAGTPAPYTGPTPKDGEVFTDGLFHAWVGEPDDQDPYPKVDKTNPGWWDDPALAGLEWRKLVAVPVNLKVGAMTPDQVVVAAVTSWMDLDPARDGTELANVERTTKWMTPAHAQKRIHEFEKIHETIGEGISFRMLAEDGRHLRLLSVHQAGRAWGTAAPDAATQVERSVLVKCAEFDESGKKKTPTMTEIFTFTLTYTHGAWMISDDDMHHPYYIPIPKWMAQHGD